MSIWQSITNLFSSSNKIKATEFYYLREKLLYWNESQNYPSFDMLPAAISFPSSFWSRVTEIHRHTMGDNHERAISVWWADGDLVVTDSIRGGVANVNIPRQKITVMYKPISGNNQYVEKVVDVNGKVYSKRRVEYRKVKGRQIEVRFLFSMHTHPPYESTGKFSFFSATDINSFLGISAAITGLVTDKLWLLIKTNKSAKANSLTDHEITPESLIDQLGLKLYRGEFGKRVVVFRPEYDTL